MKTKRILLGGLAGGVTFFLLGYVIFGLLLADYAAANINQCAMKSMEEMGWGTLILSNLAFGFILSFVFNWSNTRGSMAGAKVGGIMGLLITIGIDLSMYSMSDWFLNFGVVIVEIVVYAVMMAIGGIVVALVMGMKKEA
jgi:hypothetical protein